MAEQRIRILVCDYCGGEVPPADEEAATWNTEPSPSHRWSRAGMGAAKNLKVILCAECRDVVTVARLLEMFDEARKAS